MQDIETSENSLGSNLRRCEVPDYTEKEKQNIAKLKDEGKLSYECPNGHFWMRDYDFPTRRCPACGLIKPWADKDLRG